MAWLEPVEGEEEDLGTEEIDNQTVPKSAVRWEKIWFDVKRKLVAVHPGLGLVMREGGVVEDRVPWGVEGLGLYRNAGFK